MATRMVVMEDGDRFVCMDQNGKAQEYVVFLGQPLSPSQAKWAWEYMLRDAYKDHVEWLEHERLLDRMK